MFVTDTLFKQAVIPFIFSFFDQCQSLHQLRSNLKIQMCDLAFRLHFLESGVNMCSSTLVYLDKK